MIVMREIQLRLAAKAWLEQASRRLAESWPFRTIGPCSTVASSGQRAHRGQITELCLVCRRPDSVHSRMARLHDPAYLRGPLRSYATGGIMLYRLVAFRCIQHPEDATPKRAIHGSLSGLYLASYRRSNATADEKVSLIDFH